MDIMLYTCMMYIYKIFRTYIKTIGDEQNANKKRINIYTRAGI